MEKGSESQIRGNGHGPYIVLIALVCVLFGGIIGYGFGIAWALNWSVGVGFMMLEKQGIKIEFNEKMIVAGLYQYKNNIGGVINCDYARNNTNSGN